MMIVPTLLRGNAAEDALECDAAHHGSHAHAERRAPEREERSTQRHEALRQVDDKEPAGKKSPA